MITRANDAARRRRPTTLCIALACAVLATCCAAPAAMAVPPGFTDSLVATVSGGPTEVAWTPDGRMIISAKSGQVRIFKGGALLSTPAIDLGPRMCTNGERALGGVAVHPNFAVNRFVYLYYTFNKFGTCNESEIDGPVNRLSRFVLGDNDRIDPASETVLLDTVPLYKDHHNGGSLEFGKDGNLYVTIGDGGGASLNWSQNTGNLMGKVIRLTPDGGIPAGNAYTGATSARCNVNGRIPTGSLATRCQEIFAIGLRNPFRSAMDPNAAGTRFFINDVGQHSWEEIDESGDGYAGANYGWPVREGPCDKDLQTGCSPTPAGMTDPIYAYMHGPDGGAATGGAFPPNGLWGADYNGDYLYGEYVFGAIYRLERSASGVWSSTQWHLQNAVVSLRFGPDGALYVVTRDGGQIRKITMTGAANRPPTAVASANPSSGAIPLAVAFKGDTSSDPDGDTLSYAWDFDGNGTTDSTAANPSFTYTTEGTFSARLTVSDGKGGTNSTTVRIDAGDRAPTAVIETPTATERFAVGQHFLLHGSGTDPEDGTLPASALTWEVLQHHNTHVHPFLDATSGNDVEIIAPEPEDFDASTTSYLEIRLTVTDSNGASTTVTRDLRPKEVNVTFTSSPSGRDLIVVGERITTPRTVLAWENWEMDVQAPTQTDSSGTTWEFDSWSDGGAASHDILVGASPATYTANFRSTGSTLQTTTLTPVADTQVRGEEPTRNLGTRSTLKTDASPIVNSYLRFDLSGIGGPIQKALLRVMPTTNNSIGYSVHGLVDPSASWGELTMTYDNAPAINATAVGNSGPVTTGTRSEVDVTDLVKAGGVRTVAMKGRNSTSTEYASRETGANTPQLVVTYGSSGGGGGDTTDPSKPANLTATAVSSSRADLDWDPSTDDTGVTGYTVYRDGAVLTTVPGAQTAYSDTNATPGATHVYRVDASDAAGHRSAQSDPATVTMPSVGTPQITTFSAVADTYVKSDTPTTTFGTASTLRTDGSPDVRSFLRFDVKGLSGTVTKAVLRVYAGSANSIGYDVRGVADNGWSEALQYGNAPAAGAIAGSSGRVAASTWTEVDVTSLVTGNGLRSLAMTSTSSTATSFVSREGGANAPQLVVTTTG